MECQRLGRETGRRAKLGIRRLNRIFGERREDVGEEQLLVLLLVIDAKLDEVERKLRQRSERAFERFIDLGRQSRTSSS